MLSAEVRTLQTAAKGFEEIGSILAKSCDGDDGIEMHGVWTLWNPMDEYRLQMSTDVYRCLQYGHSCLLIFVVVLNKEPVGTSLNCLALDSVALFIVFSIVLPILR